VTAKRKASPSAVDTKGPGDSNHAHLLDHETDAVDALEQLARQKRRGWFVLAIRFCLFVTAALVIEVLLAAYEQVVEGDDA
jgi:hypothetical protein